MRHDYGQIKARVDALPDRIARLAADRESGASEIVDEVVRIFHDAIVTGAPLLPVARAICRAQPSMAPVWNVALEIVAADAEGTDRSEAAIRLDRCARRLARAPAALTRVGASFLLADEAVPLRVVTLSFSRTVVMLLSAMAKERTLVVACSEGRPALEGRRLAADLAAAGAVVTVYTDAALGHALDAAHAVVVGADAIAAEWVLNKSGTRMLAAAAAGAGVPVYVVATRDKFVSDPVARQLIDTEGAPAEVWDDPPAGVTVRNPYFERTPIELVAAVITESGVIGPADIVKACEAAPAHLPPDFHLS